MRCERGTEAGAIPVRLVLGLLIVALGAIFLAGNLGLVEIRDWLHRFWPISFVVIGLTILLQPRRCHGRWWGAVWLIAGAWIFVEQQGWVQLDFWQLFFPAVLVLFGGHLVWRAVAGPRGRRPRPANEDPDAFVRSFAVMAGNEVRSVSREFRGADLGAVMGGVALDLTQAAMAGQEAVIDVFAFWGGIDIRVPPEWGVTSRVAPLMGGFEDKSRPSSEAPSARLVVRGFAVMGGVVVKN